MHKTTIRRIASLLTTGMVIASTLTGMACAAEEDNAEATERVSPKGYTLTEIGSIEDKHEELSLLNTGAFVYVDENEDNESTGRFVNYLGEEMQDEAFLSIVALTDEVLAVATAAPPEIITEDNIGEFNVYGLISKEGEWLIPCEAADMEYVRRDAVRDSESDRYLIVKYATGLTDNEDEAYLTGQNEDDEDIYITGYGRVYDIVQRKFIDGLEITNSGRYAVTECGDYVLVNNGNDSVSVFDTDGNETLYLSVGPLACDCGDGVLVVRKGSAYQIYDAAAGEVQFEQSGVIGKADDEGKYFAAVSENGWILIDRNGERVLESEFAGNPTVNGGVAKVELEEDVKALIDIGTGEIIHSRDGVTSAVNDYYYTDFGYWYYKDDEGEVLVASSGEEVRLDGNVSYDLAINRDTDDGQYEWLILNDMDYALELSKNYSTVAPALIKHSDLHYGLYDLISGKELLAEEYGSIQMVYGHIYAFKSGEWHVFEIGLEY